MVKKFLDLGKQPIANGFLSKDEFDNEFFYDLSVGFDEETGLVTQMDYVDKELMFNDSYAYRGSMSKTMRHHFSNVSTVLKLILPSSPKVLEIGSNDGVFLKNWGTSNTIAVEPCGNFAEETNELGYKTYNSFWNTELSDEILKRHLGQDLVFAANCMCHIPEIDEAFSAVRNVLDKDGWFVFEDPSLEKMLEYNSYDQIYDEHPHIFSVYALSNLLERNGLKIISVKKDGVHGGSNRIYAKRDDSNNTVQDKSVHETISHEMHFGLDKLSRFQNFAGNVKRSKRNLLIMLNEYKAAGKKIISYGATSKSTTVFNYCGIGPDTIDCITDTTPEKIGKFSPGMHIPILSSEDGFNDSVDYAFLGAWNFMDEIIAKEKDFTGKFITHVPYVHFIN